VRDPDDRHRIHDPASRDNGRRIKFLHWAGTPANEVMPYRSIFQGYRLRAETPARRLWLRARSVPLTLLWNIINWGRNTNILSRTYKRLIPPALQYRVAKTLRRK
jgi:hypothetical protein